MIVSVNPKPSIREFQQLMSETDMFLNRDAKKRHDYYSTRNGQLLEDDVKDALDECAKGTPFEKTIEKISGQRFPDIVASKFYGVEVKSTKSDHWTSTGSSIMESTRISDVERIYMTFGKLGGNPIQFLSKPYEDCLYDIAVTHMPRYLINMQLQQGETIFDKIGVPYDELRLMDNPFEPVSRYYRSQLKPGESLWWAGDSADETVSATIRIWGNVPADEKGWYTAYGLLNYPEVFGGNYDRYAMWLTSQGIVDPHIRDQFSSGGQVKLCLESGGTAKFPGVYRRIIRLKAYLEKLIAAKDPVISDEDIKMEETPESPLGERLLDWFAIVSDAATVDYELSMDALFCLFFNEQ